MKRYSQYDRYDKRKQIFSIRKFSVGAGSALLTKDLFSFIISVVLTITFH